MGREAVWALAAGPGTEDMTSATVPVHLCQSLWRRVWLCSDCGFLLYVVPGGFWFRKVRVLSTAPRSTAEEF